MRSLVLSVLAAALVLSAQAQYQPCGKGEACPDGECCMITGNKFGTPACHPLRSSGDTCRPHSEPQNFTLSSSPYAPATLYTGVYWAVCPCQSHLQCLGGSCA